MIDKINIKSLINWMAKQNIDIQNIIMKHQNQEYHKLKNKEGSLINMEVVSFVNAIQKVKIQIEPQNSKKKTLNINNFRSNKLKILANKKVSINKKAEKLLNYKSLICELVVASYSTRQIANYLLKHHRFKVSHTLISQFIKHTIKGKENDK
jgi:hypothetical protein